MLKKLSVVVTVILFALTSVTFAQTLQNLVHQPPIGAYLPFLLTDGTVMFQGNNSATWSKLTPDSSGSYLNGTWSQLASLPSGYSPDDFASAVLADGRLVIIGGEYNFGNFVLTNLGAIYDPVANTWTSLQPPTGWDFIGDSPSVVVPNGKFVVGNKLDMRVAALDPATLTWTADGRLSLYVAPSGTWPGPLPKIGLRLVLDAVVEEVSWFGRGPGEAYRDTYHATRVGRFTTPVDGLATPYVRPQENGNRLHARRLDHAERSPPSGSGGATS